MKSSTFALVASFATTILASPHHLAQHAERDVVVVTATDVHVDMVEVTQWVTAGAPQVTTDVTVTASSPASQETHGNNRKFGPGGDHSWSWQQSESAPAFSAPAPPPPAPTTSTTSTTAPAFSWPAPESTSAPAFSWPAPTSTAPAFSWPAPSSTSTTAAPTTAAPATTAANNPGTNTAGLSYTNVVSPFPSPSSVATSGDEAYNPYDGTLQQASLDSTNKWRSNWGVGNVAWNYTLEQALLNMMWDPSGDGCIFQHTDQHAGQNLAAGYDSPGSSIDGWGNEYKDITNGDWSSASFPESSWHFTQLVWKDTDSIACVARNCDGKNGHWGGWYYICDYYPAGNVSPLWGDNLKQVNQS